VSFCKTWLLLVDPPDSGIRNMSRDTALLDWVEQNQDPATAVRFFSWETPTISLGRNQKAEETVSLPYCRKAGLPVVNRPTGGRAVYHGEELTYSLVSNDREVFPLHNIQSTHQLIALALKSGLEKLGVQVQLSDGKNRSVPLMTGKNPCFASASRSELLIQGRKIVGSAQRHLKRSFLQHGSIPLDVDYHQMSSALGVPSQALRKALVGLAEALGRPVSFRDTTEALKTGIEQYFEVRLECPGPNQAVFPGINCVSRTGYAIESMSSRESYDERTHRTKA